MFARNQVTGSKATLADIKSVDASKAASSPGVTRTMPPPIETAKLAETPTPSQRPPHTSVASGFSMGSIIGNDLTIVGQGLRIITRGTLQVDGKVEGDVMGSEVIIGEKGHVTGVVSAESVIVRGEVHGTIRGIKVALQSGAHVEGDVHHQQLSVEQGAHLDGRVRRPENVSELRPDLDPDSRAKRQS